MWSIVTFKNNDMQVQIQIFIPHLLPERISSWLFKYKYKAKASRSNFLDYLPLRTNSDTGSTQISMDNQELAIWKSSQEMKRIIKRYICYFIQSKWWWWKNSYWTIHNECMQLSKWYLTRNFTHTVEALPYIQFVLIVIICYSKANDNQ